MKKWTDSKLRKEYITGVYCHPAYLTAMQRTSGKMPGWMKHKLESRLLGKLEPRLLIAISVTSDMQMTQYYGRKHRGTKEPLNESERGK